MLVVVEDDAVTYLPDEIIGSACAEPFLEDIPDAESVIPTCEEEPRALQFLPAKYQFGTSLVVELRSDVQTLGFRE